MRKLTSFTFLTLNGFYKGLNEYTGWHHQLNSKEAADYAANSSSSGNALLFGRKTYDMMAGFWPSPQAAAAFPTVAENMNKAQKFVFSTSLKSAAWQNTSILSGDILEQVKQLKQSSGNDMTILGSGSILSQLADAGLIDEYHIMLDPVILGQGTPIFNNINTNRRLKLTSSRLFEQDGILLLVYENFGILK